MARHPIQPLDEAIRAYANFLTPDLVEQIEGAASDRIIRLNMGGGPTRLTVEGRTCICVGNEKCDVCDPELLARVES